jgi:hypothetical protein
MRMRINIRLGVRSMIIPKWRPVTVTTRIPYDVDLLAVP